MYGCPLRKSIKEVTIAFAEKDQSLNIEYYFGKLVLLSYDNTWVMTSEMLCQKFYYMDTSDQLIACSL